MRTILMFYKLWGAKSQRLYINHNFWRERRAEAESNQGESAYQPNTLPLGPHPVWKWVKTVVSHEACIWQICFCAIRFGIGRFTTEQEIDYTAEKCIRHVKRLREMRWVCTPACPCTCLRALVQDCGTCIASCPPVALTEFSACLGWCARAAVLSACIPSGGGVPCQATFFWFLFNCRPDITILVDWA